MTEIEPVSPADVGSWAEAVAMMYYGESGSDPELWTASNEATANLMSGWGLIVPLPSEVFEMIRPALPGR